VTWIKPNLVELASTAEERSAHVAYDGKKLWFVSTAAGSQDLYVGVKGLDGRFDRHRIDELSTATDDDDPWVSRDEHGIYFARDHVGSPDVSDLMMADR
jgi:Tol biopolymer transport system component